MQNDRNSYEINTDSVPTYSHGRHIASDAIRGFVAGARGVLEGRKMKREAADDREKRIADEAYRQRVLDLKNKQITLQDVFQHKELTDTTTLQKQLAEMQNAIQEGKLELMQQQQEDYKALAEAELEVRQTEGEANRQAAKNLAKIQGRIDRRNIILGIKHQQSESEKQRTHEGEMINKTTKAEEAEREDTQEHEEGLIEKKGDQDRQTLEKSAELEEAAKDAEFKRKVDAAVTLGIGGFASLTPEQRKEARQWVTKVTDDLFQDQSYKTLRNSSIQWATILGTAANPQATAADDIALLNTFQRLIDPGVSVREGDVELLQRTMDFLSKVGIEIEAISDGRRVLTDEARQDFLQTAYNIVTKQQELLYSRVKTYAENMLNLYPELKGSLKFEDIVPQIFGEMPAPTGQRQDGRIPNTDNATLNDASIQSLVDLAVKNTRKTLQDDLILDDTEKQQLQNGIEQALAGAEEKMKLPKGALVNKYKNKIYSDVLKELDLEDTNPENEKTPTPPNVPEVPQPPDVPEPPPYNKKKESKEVKVVRDYIKIHGKKYKTREEFKVFVEEVFKRNWWTSTKLVVGKKARKEIKDFEGFVNSIFDELYPAE